MEGILIQYHNPKMGVAAHVAQAALRGSRSKGRGQHPGESHTSLKGIMLSLCLSQRVWHDAQDSLSPLWLHVKISCRAAFCAEN